MPLHPCVPPLATHPPVRPRLAAQPPVRARPILRPTAIRRVGSTLKHRQRPFAFYPRLSVVIGGCFLPRCGQVVVEEVIVHEDVRGVAGRGVHGPECTVPASGVG